MLLKMKFLQSQKNMIKSRSIVSIFIITVTLCISGCSSQPDFPPINYSSSKEYSYGQVVWRDLVTPNPKLAAEFYLKVFGWTAKQVESGNQPYWIFKNNGKPVAGMYLMSEARKNAGGEWIPYFSVNLFDDFIGKSKFGGGTVDVKPIEIRGRGNVALLSDPQKAYYAIIKSVNGDPPAADPMNYEFLWSELWSNEVEKSSLYYTNVFNSKIENSMDDNRPYNILMNNGKKSAGIIKNPVENVRTHWIQYVRVPDIGSVEQKAKDAGAKIIIPSDSTIRKGTVSVFIDPTGAPIAIQKWPIE